ncbi:MAG: cell division protein ZapE [Sinomonas sp.]|nr:cell division protein ZapE [Sinomonas sp.]
MSTQHAGWASSRVLVPGTPSQLGAFGLFAPPASTAVVLPAARGEVRALAADGDLLWLAFSEVARVGADGTDWAARAPLHALWVVSGVPVLSEAPPESAQAFAALAEILRAADVPLVVVAREDPGPLPAPLPVETAEGDGMPPSDLGT